MRAAPVELADDSWPDFDVELELELAFKLKLDRCWLQLEGSLPREEPRFSLAVDLLSRLFVYFRLLVGVVDRSLYVHYNI